MPKCNVCGDDNQFVEMTTVTIKVGQIELDKTEAWLCRACQPRAVKFAMKGVTAPPERKAKAK